MSTQPTTEELLITSIAEIQDIHENQSTQLEKQVQSLSEQLKESMSLLDQLSQPSRLGESVDWFKIGRTYYRAQDFDQIIVQNLTEDNRSKGRKLLKLFVEKHWHTFIIDKPQFNKIIKSISGDKIHQCI